MSDSLQPHGLEPGRILCSWNFPGKNTGVDCQFLLQGIFLTQETNPHLESPTLVGRFFYHRTTCEVTCVISPCSSGSESVSCSVVSDSLRAHGLWPTRLLCPWDSPGKNTAVGCHFLLQGNFPTQGSNLGFLHCRQILYRLSHQGSPF